jgi:hypothetical protein
MKGSRPQTAKAVLRLPNLEQAESAVPNSMASPGSLHCYEFVIENLVHWYCSEPWLAWNRIVVTPNGTRTASLWASHHKERLAAGL